jgi:hypothetical protein
MVAIIFHGVQGADPPAGRDPGRRAGHGRRGAGLERHPARHPTPASSPTPLRLLPANWQDTGSGVFALAATAMLLSLGPLTFASARRTIALAVLCGVAALLVDVHLC